MLLLELEVEYYILIDDGRSLLLRVLFFRMYGSCLKGNAEIYTNAPPIAIIMSLSQTLSSSLYCPLITQDSSDKVASRGILYLLILSQ